MALVWELCSDLLNSGLFHESSFSGKFEFSLRKLDFQAQEDGLVLVLFFDMITCVTRITCSRADLILGKILQTKTGPISGE